jgi:hypothetical protein
VIEVIGEGHTDVGIAGISGEPSAPSPPNKGVVPIVVHALCGKPDTMLVVRRHYAFLQSGGKTRTQKVHFAKRQALHNNSAGVVFVLDSEGNFKGRKKELLEGRDRQYPEYPAAVGVAHPCIEAWLLADAAAVAEGLNLAKTPAVTAKPEELPAPCHDAKKNPKAMLREIAQRAISVSDKERIAVIADISTLRQRCPLGFSPFADEVEKHIRPLFQEPCSPA